MNKALAIDIGGTKISSCLIDKNGEIKTQIEKYSTPKSADEIFTVLKSIIDKYSEFDVVAIATAGAVNICNTNVIGSTANLPKGYKDIDFSSLTDKKVFIENDANAAAWAEFKLGSAKDYANAIIVTLGTGIGGGVVIENKLFRGKSGAGAEIGHIKIHAQIPRKCTCGSDNCFEAYASGTGLRKTLQEVASSNETFKTSLLKDKDVCDLTTYDLVDAFKKNDEFAKNIFDIWHEHIGQGLLSLNNVFDTDVFVLSGSMAEFVDFNYLENYTNSQTVTTKTKVVKAQFDNNSGMVGVALLALEKYEK